MDRGSIFSDVKIWNKSLYESCGVSLPGTKGNKTSNGDVSQLCPPAAGISLHNGRWYGLEAVDDVRQELAFHGVGRQAVKPVDRRRLR